MPLLPIPACVEDVFGQDLKDGLKYICIIIIILSLLPILLIYSFCSHQSSGFTTDDPVSFATLLALIVAIIVLVLLFLEEIPPIVHFIMVIVWVVVTIEVILCAIYLITHHRKSLFGGNCGISLFIAFVCFVLIAVCMLIGIFVYWSFYAEND